MDDDSISQIMQIAKPADGKMFRVGEQGRNRSGLAAYVEKKEKNLKKALDNYIGARYNKVTIYRKAL